MLRMHSALRGFMLASLFLVIVILVQMVASPAFAQAVDNTVDISGITSQIVSIAMAVLSALAIALGEYLRRWLAKKTEFANTEAALALQKQYNQAIAWGMAYAESKAPAVLPDKVTVNNDFLRYGVEFIVRSWPQLTKGMSEDKIRDSILARLPTGPITDDAKMIASAPDA